MEKYEMPEMEIVEFESESAVIIASPNTCTSLPGGDVSTPASDMYG